MKYLKFVVIVFALYFLGYILGPILGPVVVKERKEENKSVAVVDYQGARYTINLDSYEVGELPKTLKITKATTIPTLSGEGEVLLKKGDRVELVERGDKGLTVAKADPSGKGSINASHTDLFTQLAKRTYDREQAKSKVAIVTAPKLPNTAASAAKAEMQTEKTSTPEIAPEPAPIVEKTSDLENMPAGDPEKKEMPTGKVEETAGVNGNLSDDEVLALMKKSIKEGALKEFTFDQVKGWKVTGSETVDGTEYQTGLAAYEATTIFGVRPVQAKALIKGGKIERWIFAKSGMEIQ